MVKIIVKNRNLKFDIDIFLFLAYYEYIKNCCFGIMFMSEHHFCNAWFPTPKVGV